jgi:FixJ family two-component response regulator
VGVTRVAVLADDLIWSTRLAAIVRAIGAEPVPVRSLAALVAAFPDRADRAIVDLTARAYDGIEAIAAAVAAGVPVLAVGQHDDVALHRRAIAAGAQRVVPYRALTVDSGRRTVARWAVAPAGRAATTAVVGGTDRE